MKNLENIIIKSRAKLNLTLEILRKRKDNYHDIVSIMQSIDLYDNLYIEKNNSGKIFVKVIGARNLDNENNIVHKAAYLFFKYTKIKCGCSIKIEKKIPMEAGLAGGSSNAAATIVGLDRIFQTNLSDQEKIDIAKNVGSDVVFCLFGGTMLASGTGDKIAKMKDLDLNILLIKPSKSISTKIAFNSLEEKDYSDGSNTKNIVEIINNTKNTNEIYKYMINTMYNKSVLLVPEMKDIILTLEEDFNCNKAMMSGSGSTVFGIFENTKDINDSYNYFSKIYEDVYITKTTNSSLEIIERGEV